MILPSKHISEEQSLLGVGAVLLYCLEQPQTVTSLWDKVRDDPSVGTYERFVLALDLLHITGVINLSQGMIQREAS
ncbi:ABC-three component system middle component 6 [Methanofollis fontis]|uniref:Uncharacterized protein n=1 Tax=Methanofollis fontis TaxID=2052832 RepID=A0A483CTP3_9EURY|nr:ABC-three component system middle component 6 [Methanofollis fontis]TAJ44084.1 hypothetical protein CUJ86_08610 [Methanofollis fontis]